MTTTASLPTTEILGRHLRTRPDGMVQMECRRCADGDGYISSYRHVHGGVCFECGGHGGHWVTVAEATATYRRRDADKRRRDAKRDAKAAKAQAARDAFAEEHPRLVEAMAASEHHIIVDMFERLERYGTLSEKQVALAEKILAEAAQRTERRAAERAAASPAPTGRVQVVGEIVAFKETQNDFSYSGGSVYKMFVKADAGWRVYLTVPREITPDVFADDYPVGTLLIDVMNERLRGQRVELTATLEQAKDDETMAFGKRPTKARVLAA